jgi:hypothetical protein
VEAARRGVLAVAPAGLDGLLRAILETPAGFRMRLVLAVAAWPPLGVAGSLLIGELTGCARFAASCAGTASFGSLVLAAQLAILVALLAIAPLARIGAVGSLAVVLAALPVVAFLTAAGAPYAPEAGPTSLLALLGIAYVLGAVLGWRAVRRLGRTRRA